MDDHHSINQVLLCGCPAHEPVFSHESRGEKFYSFPLDVARLSGAMDRINIIVRRPLLDHIPIAGGKHLRIQGELRSFNNRSGEGSRLIITVFSRIISPVVAEVWENRVELEGVLCRDPVYRVTPLGREICDMLLSVARPYGRCDYLPCILWGQNARRSARWSAGMAVHILGRIQSREYVKNLEGKSIRRVAYEVSATEAETFSREKDD